MVQLRGYLERILGPLLKAILQLMANVLKPLNKSVLELSGLTAAASATDVAVQQKMFGSGMHPAMLVSRPSN